MSFAAGAALELRQQCTQAAKRLNALVQIAIVFVAKHGGRTIATGAHDVWMSQQLASGFIWCDVAEDVCFVHAINMAAFWMCATGYW